MTALSGPSRRSPPSTPTERRLRGLRPRGRPRARVARAEMCILCHPGPRRRWEAFDSWPNALARQAWYAANNDPWWRVLYDCDDVQIAAFPQALIAAQANDPPTSPPGANAAARWVAQMSVVQNLLYMPPGAAAGLQSYGHV